MPSIVDLTEEAQIERNKNARNEKEDAQQQIDDRQFANFVLVVLLERWRTWRFRKIANNKPISAKKIIIKEENFEEKKVH